MQPRPNEGILGDLYAVRTTQSAVLVTIEVPLEDFTTVVALLGAPDRANGNPVVIAPMREAAIQLAPSAQEEACEHEYVVRNKVDGHLYCEACGVLRIEVNPEEASEDPVSKLWPEHMQKPHRSWGDLPASQRAALMCKDRDFQTRVGVKSEDDADAWLKSYCGIKSKTELLPGSVAMAFFESAETDWLSHKKLPPITAYEEVR